MPRFTLLILALLIIAACGSDNDRDPAVETTPDVAYAMRWWNTLTPEQMVASLHGDEATEEEAAAAKKMYADLDDATKALVNEAADTIYGDGDFGSLGEWWESLDCLLMRVAGGDGNVADPQSPYCRHYPGYDFEIAKVLERETLYHVHYVGSALLDFEEMTSYAPADMNAFHELAGGTVMELTYDADYGDFDGARFKAAFTEIGRHYSFDDPDFPGDYPGNYVYQGVDEYTGMVSFTWDSLENDPAAGTLVVELMFLEMDAGVWWGNYTDPDGEGNFSGTFELVERVE